MRESIYDDANRRFPGLWLHPPQYQLWPGSNTPTPKIKSVFFTPLLQLATAHTPTVHAFERACVSTCTACRRTLQDLDLHSQASHSCEPPLSNDHMPCHRSDLTPIFPPPTGFQCNAGHVPLRGINSHADMHRPKQKCEVLPQHRFSEASLKL